MPNLFLNSDKVVIEELYFRASERYIILYELRPIKFSDKFNSLIDELIFNTSERYIIISRDDPILLEDKFKIFIFEFITIFYRTKFWYFLNAVKFAVWLL